MTLPANAMTDSIVSVDDYLRAVDARSLVAPVAFRLNASQAQVRNLIHDHLSPPASMRDASDTPTSAVPIWPANLTRGELCDATLMQAGIADLAMPPSKSVFPVSLGNSILQCASMEASPAATSPSRSSSQVKESLVNAIHTLAPNATPGNLLFIPLCYVRHWGFVVVTFATGDNAKLRGVVQWGDSLRRGPPPGVLPVVQSVVKTAYSISLCTADDTVDYMLDVHKFAQQTDSFASGFYVLSLLSINATSTRYLPRRPLILYNLAHIEDIRDACAVSYFHHLYVLHLQHPKRALGRRDVFEFLLRGGAGPPNKNDAHRQLGAVLSSSGPRTTVGQLHFNERNDIPAQHTPPGTAQNSDKSDLKVDGGEGNKHNGDDTEDGGNGSTVSVSRNDDDIAMDDVEGQSDAVGGDVADEMDGTDGVDDTEKPKVTELVHDIVGHYQNLASQGFFFGNTSHQGLKGRSGRGQLYCAYIQLRCIKYPGDQKRNIPKCKAKLRYDKLRDSDGWHASLFAEHSHPPLPEKLRSRRESQVIQTLRDVQMQYLPRHPLQRSKPYGLDPRDNSNVDRDPKSAEKILPRPPHLNRIGQPVQSVLISPIHTSKQPPQPTVSVLTAHPVLPHNVTPQISVSSVTPSLPVHTIQPQSQPPISVHPSPVILHPSSQPLLDLSSHHTPSQSVQHSQIHSSNRITVGPSSQHRSAVPIAPRDNVNQHDFSQNVHVARSSHASIHGQQVLGCIHPVASSPNNLYQPNNPKSSSRQPIYNLNTTAFDQSKGPCQNPIIGTVSFTAPYREATFAEIEGQSGNCDVATDRQASENVDCLNADDDVGVVGSSNDRAAETVPDPMDGMFKLRGEDLMPLRNGGAGLALVEALRAYVGTSHVKLAENEMAQHIKKIAEQCGYKLRIRRSMYHAGQENVFIKSATFECAQKVRNGCPFAFRLRGHLKRRRSADTSDGENSCSEEDIVRRRQDSQAIYTTMVHFLNQTHNHEHDHSLLRKHIHQPDVPNAPVRLARTDGLTVGNVIRHVEKKHSFMVPRTPLRKKIIAERQTKDPLAQQCNALVSHLMTLKNEQPATFVHFAPEGPRKTLSRICWSFSEWQEDYMTFGRVPGIYIDTTELTNHLKLPLVSINGRTNTGDTVTFFVSFIAEKSEESLSWMLKQFRTCMSRGESYTPKIIALEDCQASVSAARAIFPSSWILLDEYSIAENEERYVKEFLDALDMNHLAEEMSSRLRRLRKSRSYDDFAVSRKSFETTFFSKLEGCNDQPNWYKRLYYDEKELVVNCFNRTCSGLRFLFDGIGYTQTFSSVHELSVNNTLIESFEVPELLREAIKTRTSFRTAKRAEVVTDTMGALNTRLDGVKQQDRHGLEFICTFTDFCLQNFTRESLTGACHWEVQSCSVQSDKIDNGETIKTVSFQVVKSIDVENCDEGCSLPGSEWLVMVSMRFSHLESKWFESSCECGFSSMSGIPCVHQVVVLQAFNDEKNERADVARAHLNTLSLPLSHFFHKYWKRDFAEWGDMIPALRNQCRIGNPANRKEIDHVASTSKIRAVFQAGKEEWSNHLEYAANKALFERAWNEVENMEKREKDLFYSTMAHLVLLCRRRKVPDLKTLAPAPSETIDGESDEIGFGACETNFGGVSNNNVGGGEAHTSRGLSTEVVQPAAQRRRVDNGNSNEGTGTDFCENFGSGNIFPNEISQLRDDGEQQTGYGASVAGKSVFESVMRRLGS